LTRGVGIHLGMIHAAAAVHELNGPALINRLYLSDGRGDEWTRRPMPSVVTFPVSGEVLVGEWAGPSIWRPRTPSDRTIWFIRRHMGTDWSVSIDGENFTPQQISAFVLKKLKSDAEVYLGEEIADAVITVPVYFSDAQRQATEEACRMAGLKVLRIINEPTAAAMAYHLDQGTEVTILVFDLGARSFDVSLLEIRDGVVEVKATSGAHDLGGHDWDQQIVGWLVKDLRNSYGIDLSEDKNTLRRLREVAESIKNELSNSLDAQIDLPYLYHSGQGPLHAEARLSLGEFQRITAGLIGRCKRLTDQLIGDAGITAGDIDHVVLVSNATRMPAVIELVKNLTGKEPREGFNPNEVVAIGACLQAHVIKDAEKREKERSEKESKVGLVGDVARGKTSPADALLGNQFDIRASMPQLPEVMGREQIAGHVFISYMHENSDQVDRLQGVLQSAGIPVWRDTVDLWPGEDWRLNIRRAISENALVFIACFSDASLTRAKSYQNEELTLAIEQLRLRSPGDPWLIPVRLHECEIPDRDIGGGRTLASIQRVDLFGDNFDTGAARLIQVVMRILGRY
jgi:hypothetical protein